MSVEAIGSDDPAIDAELIQLYDELLRRLGVTRVPAAPQLDRRPRVPSRLRRATQRLAGRARRPARRRGPREARRRARCASSTSRTRRVQRALADAPRIGDALCDECREHFAAVRGFLDGYGVAYELVPTLVRGLDYYTRTTFEFVDEAIGAQSAILGGGRYDYLIEELGGPPTPGIGFGAGLERLLLSLGDETSRGRGHRRLPRVRAGRAARARARDAARAATPRAGRRHRLRGAARSAASSPTPAGSAPTSS